MPEVAEEVHQQEAFGDRTPFSQRYRAEFGRACDCAERTLLGQGYLVHTAAVSNVTAGKEFQPKSDLNVVIQVFVVCKGEAAGSTVFANAVETHNSLKKSRQSTSLNVPGGIGISLPLGSTTEQLVKVEGRTVENSRYYERFFASIASCLGEASARTERMP